MDEGGPLGIGPHRVGPTGRRRGAPCTARVLLAVRDRSGAELLTQILAASGFQSVEFCRPANVMTRLHRGRVDAVLLDVSSTESASLSLAAAMRQVHPDIPIIALGASVGAEATLACRGIHELVPLPVEVDRLLGATRRVLATVRDGPRPASEYSRPEPCHHSRVMDQLWREVVQIAPRDCTVVLEGETGTGKGLLAHLIHERSPRRRRPFVVADCGAVKPELIETALFGHERGAFTTATQQHVGYLEEAHTGTVFLDEVGELPLDVQARLLGFLDNRTFRKVGGRISLRSDTRVIAATNRDLATLVSVGRFREDLFHRLDVVRLRVPPLRERAEDLLPLAFHFLTDMCRSEGRTPDLASESVAWMQRYHWPGNVRELRNVLERSLALSAADASLVLRHGSGTAQNATKPSGILEGLWSAARQQAIADFERAYLERLLRRHNGNVSAAAVAAGLGRTKLHAYLRRHSISALRFRTGNGAGSC